MDRAFLHEEHRFHQVVPRPADARLGAAPSWRHDAAVDLGRLAALLRSTLRDEHPSVTSAVLVGLVERPGSPTILLTRRAARMRSEPLTVSFPGGRLEPGESPIDAALREANEEIGLDPNAVEVLGTLSVAGRRRDGASVLPVVGIVAGGFVPIANPDEVDEVLEVPLVALLEKDAAWSEHWGSGAARREIRFFAHGGALGRDLVWGLTARMLWELLELAVAASAD